MRTCAAQLCMRWVPRGQERSKRARPSGCVSGRGGRGGAGSEQAHHFVVISLVFWPTDRLWLPGKKLHGGEKEDGVFILHKMQKSLLVFCRAKNHGHSPDRDHARRGRRTYCTQYTVVYKIIVILLSCVVASLRRRKKHLIPDRIGLCVCLVRRKKHKWALSQYNTLYKALFNYTI